MLLICEERRYLSMYVPVTCIRRLMLASEFLLIFYYYLWSIFFLAFSKLLHLNYIYCIWHDALGWECIETALDKSICQINAIKIWCVYIYTHTRIKTYIIYIIYTCIKYSSMGRLVWFLLLEFTTKIHMKDGCYIGTLSWCSIFHCISVCDLISKPIGNDIRSRILLYHHSFYSIFSKKMATIFG